MRPAAGARLQNRAIEVAGTTAVDVAGFQDVAAELSDRAVRVDIEEARRLRIQIADRTILVDGIDSLDDPGEHGLRLGLAPAQRTRQIDEIAAHVLHGARQSANFGGAARRNGGGEISLAEAHRRCRECPHGGCDHLAEHDAGEHREDREHERGHLQTPREMTCRLVDRRRRQARFDERDRLAGRCEHRDAGSVQIKRRDALHRRVAIGERGGMQRREVIDGGGREASIIDQAYRQSHVLAQRARQLHIQVAHDVDARRLGFAEACRGAHDRGRGAAGCSEKALALFGARGHDLVPGQGLARLRKELRPLEHGAGIDGLRLAEAPQEELKGFGALLRDQALQRRAVGEHVRCVVADEF